MARVTRLLAGQLRLKVNEAKRAGARPWHRTCLGCPFTRRPPHRRQGSEKALKAFKAKVRAITGRTRGRTSRQIGPELRPLILGWGACFGVAEVRSPLRDLDQGLRRRRRSSHWQPWGRKRYRELRTRGGGRQLAWNTGKSAPGPWRRRQSPALAMALPPRDFAALGLPSLREGGPPTESPEPPESVTRTSGGVGGREPRGSPPYPDSAALLHVRGIFAEFEDTLEGVAGDAVACLQRVG